VPDLREFADAIHLSAERQMDKSHKQSPVSQPSFYLSRWLFLRLLGLVYLIAFLSLWSQVHGLIGSRGILPVSVFLDTMHHHFGNDAYWRLPTLCWIDTSDRTLTMLCAAGTACSLFLLVGLAPTPSLVALWMIYLSLSIAGQTFFQFQWDTLLLETGFFAIFYSPLLSILPRLSKELPPSRLARWMLWWLLLKLMLLSGITKLLSGDPTWQDLTAMNFHYETQPIPNWVSWYAHQMPEWWQKTTVMMTLTAELLVPFFIFTPRLLRHIATILLVLFQVTIQVTGNFGFFNLLTGVLCITLLDDRALRRMIPQQWRDSLNIIPCNEHTVRHQEIILSPLLITMLFISSLTFISEIVRTPQDAPLPSAVNSVLKFGKRYFLMWGRPYVLNYTAPFRTINGYGLFRVMTTKRPEIVIEGSKDGITWTEYEFRWKPGDLHRSPPVVAPHMPRLDWQMWFAAFNPRDHLYWLESLVQRLLENEPEVTRLLDDRQVAAPPPRFARLHFYLYEFTNQVEMNRSGQWWRRTHHGWSRPLSLSP